MFEVYAVKYAGAVDPCKEISNVGKSIVGLRESGSTLQRRIPNIRLMGVLTVTLAAIFKGFLCSRIAARQPFLAIAVLGHNRPALDEKPHHRSITFQGIGRLGIDTSFSM